MATKKKKVTHSDLSDSSGSEGGKPKPPTPKPAMAPPPTPKAPEGSSLSDLKAKAAGLKGSGDGKSGEVSDRTGKPKRKYTKRAKTPDLSFPVESLRPLCEFPFTYMAKRSGDHWKLSAEESTTLAQLTKAVADKWGSAIAPFASEVMLAGYVVSITAVRLMQTSEGKNGKNDSRDSGKRENDPDKSPHQANPPSSGV